MQKYTKKINYHTLIFKMKKEKRNYCLMLKVLRLKVALAKANYKP